nr:ATP-binding protein [uncultured Holophaga sp.]
MSRRISRRLLQAFTWIVILLLAQIAVSVLSQRSLMRTWRRLDEDGERARRVEDRLHGAYAQAAILVSSRDPEHIDQRAGLLRMQLGGVEALVPPGGLEPGLLDRLRLQYRDLLDHQEHLAFEMARQDLLQVMPLHEAAMAQVSAYLAQAEAHRRRAQSDALRLNVSVGVVLGGLAILVALLWAHRLQGEFTDRRRAEATLATALGRLQSVLDASTQVAIVMTDVQGTILVFNRGAEQLLGWSQEEVVGRETPLLWHDARELEECLVSMRGHGEPESSPFAVFRHMALVGDPEKARWTWTTRQGERRLVDLVVTPVNDHEGSLSGFLMIAIDVSERVVADQALKEQDERLRQSQKMDAIGQLAGGVAHDFNNMLAGIMGAADLLGDALPAGDPRGDLVRIIRRASERAADLTSKLLAFSRKGKLVSTPLELHRIVEDSVALLRRSIDRKIAIQLWLGADRPQVVGDPSQLENALLNLCINARDAMPEGGTLTIRTEEVRIPEPRSLPLGFELEPGSYVGLCVEDTGHGIPVELQARIFEPFFTTKLDGKGTGLGLAAVYGIVNDHHGGLELHSEPGGGTAFRILLPLDERPRLSNPKVGREEITGAGAILIIDDEDLIRSTTGLLLESMGFDVLQAEDGPVGLALFARHRAEIRLVILDMVMPGLSGAETFERLQELDPGVRVVAASGFISDHAVAQMQAKGLRGFLHKPYSRAELADAVRQGLA